jgi:hypothetical protein
MQKKWRRTAPFFYAAPVGPLVFFLCAAQTAAHIKKN